MPKDLKQPYPPMEAVSVEKIPEGAIWRYEPKWDGFRCLAFKDGDKVELQSKSEKSLTRGFPEVVHALGRLKTQSVVLDGELVISVSGELSFDHLLGRLATTPAMAKKLASKHPAVFFVFDLLAKEGDVLTGEPLSKRREQLEAFAETFLDDNGTIRLSPATHDVEVARKWLSLAGGSLDGVVAKRLDLPYQSGESRAMQKIKRLRTRDCVVGGISYSSDRKAVGYLHLGLYENGLLNFVGSAPHKAAEGKRVIELVTGIIEPHGFTGKLPGELRGQFGRVISEWHPLAPALVAEVQYDQFTGGRFRSGAKFIRWRPEKKYGACTVAQIAT
jgi:ATP-dependent DNA ligase